MAQSFRLRFGAVMVAKSECPPLLRKLPECVLTMVMEYHGRAPLGIPNEVYYSDRMGRGVVKDAIDAWSDHLESFELHDKGWSPDRGRMRFVRLGLKRTEACMLSLMRAQLQVKILYGGKKDFCFVTGMSKNKTSVKFAREGFWKGKWLNLDALRAIYVELPYDFRECLPPTAAP